MLEAYLKLLETKMTRVVATSVVLEQRRAPATVAEDSADYGAPRKQKSSYEGMLALLVVVPLLVALIPSPVDPVAYKYSNKTVPELVGILAVNTGLQKATKIQFSEAVIGAESFVVDSEGLVYSGLKDGRIIRMNMTSGSFSVVSSDTVSSLYCDAPGGDCRRPLGMDFDSEGNLIVADIFRGLIKLNVTTGHEEFLISDSTHPDLTTIGFNNLVVLPNGSIFVTQFCQRRDFFLEVLEGIPSGRLLHYNPFTGKVDVIISDLFLPNGAVLGHDKESILISETGRARILRYYFSGPMAGNLVEFADNLPGLPDNIQPSSDGGYWVAFPHLRTYWGLDFAAENPWIRRIFAHFRLVIGLMMPRHAMVAKLNGDGEIVQTLHDERGQTMYSISEAFEYNNELIIGTFEAPFVGRLKLNHS